ncbi:MAG: SurA N-terminal domain-containing protein [Gammaproteobacteria bacterium]|nr:SurA N-terminal domain-containing protein [Gammaproteobacteria bacterium]
MLQNIRDNSQGIIAKVIIGLIIAVFALFGVESIIGGFISAPNVAEVNGEEITEAQFQFSTQSLINSLGVDADIEQSLLEQAALNQLIEESLLRQSAEKAGMLVSSARIDRSILENPGFQINGVFDSDLAIRTMATAGYTAPLYREALGESLLMGQLSNAINSSAFITDHELESIAELTLQTRDFRYVSVTLGTRTLDTPISDEEIVAYYEANPDQFRENEKVTVEYVSLDREVIAAEIEVDEADLLAQYEAEREEFEGSSEKRAAHILFEIENGQTEAEVVMTAGMVKQRLENGEDFGELALEFSSDTISAEQGGDIGYTDGSAFPESVEVALGGLSLDEISDPVVSEFGVHLVKLTEDSERVFEGFEDVSERIERELKSAEVDLIYAEHVEDLSNLAFESGDLQSISEAFGLEIQQSEAFDRLGGTGLFANTELITAAFSDEVLLEGNNSDVLELPSGEAVVLRMLQFDEARVLPLEDVEAEIAVLLRTDMERRAVQELGVQLVSAAEAGTGLDELLQQNELVWVDAAETGRNAFDVNAQLLAHVFALAAPEADSPAYSSLTLNNDTFVLVELNEVNAGQLETYDEAAKAGMVQSLRSDLGLSDFASYVLTLRESADIRASILDEEPF